MAEEAWLTEDSSALSRHFSACMLAAEDKRWTKSDSCASKKGNVQLNQGNREERTRLSPVRIDKVLRCSKDFKPAQAGHDVWRISRTAELANRNPVLRSMATQSIESSTEKPHEAFKSYPRAEEENGNG